jgi:Tfp pilus assembly protein PilN
MAALKKVIKINLLPQEEFAKSTFGRILTWALSGFRVIVIAVELIVMAAFLSRFWLDAKINDLNDVIRQKQALISSQGEFEKKFRDIQTRITIFSGAKAMASTPSTELEKIAAFLPMDVALSSFTFNEGKVQIKGVAGSEISVAQLMANLEGTKQYKEVLLTSVGNDPKNEAMITFILDLTLGTTEQKKGT